MATLDDLQRRQLLADFLKSRRARLRPQELGFFPGARRRTPGLRREEVAALANVGVAWYTALEQAKDVHPSPPVLSSLASVLKLSPEEHRHLFLLAGQFYTAEGPPRPTSVTPALETILASVSPHPAYLLDHCWNYVAWNPEASDLFGLPQAPGQGGPNLVWELFANPDKRRLYPDWSEVATHVVSEFRAEVEPLASLDEVQDLLGRLLTQKEFSRLWAAHPIVGTIDRRKTLVHPARGRLVLEYTTFRVAVQDGLRLIVYTPAP